MIENLVSNFTTKPMENKHTAVQWLVANVQANIAPNYIPKKFINMAIQIEQEQMIELIQFVRTHNKMGKSVDDLFYEYYNKNYLKEEL